MKTIFKISVRFTLNELRCKFLSFFDVISDFEEGAILFFLIAIMFGMKKGMEAKEKNRETRRKNSIQQIGKK